MRSLSKMPDHTLTTIIKRSMSITVALCGAVRQRVGQELHIGVSPASIAKLRERWPMKYGRPIIVPGPHRVWCPQRYSQTLRTVH